MEVEKAAAGKMWGKALHVGETAKRKAWRLEPLREQQEGSWRVGGEAAIP